MWQGYTPCLFFFSSWYSLFRFYGRGGKSLGKDVKSVLIELPTVWIAVLNVAGWPVIQMTLAWAFTQIPASKFTPPEPFGWEQNGSTYERFFAIKRWKDWLPDAGPWFRGGFAKRTLTGVDADYFSRFVRETWRSELCHWAALGCAAVFFLWNPAWAGVIMVSFGVFLNVPCIIAQRYNRIRFRRVLTRSCEKTRHAGSGTITN